MLVSVTTERYNLNAYYTQVQFEFGYNSGPQISHIDWLNKENK